MKIDFGVESDEIVEESNVLRRGCDAVLDGLSMEAAWITLWNWICHCLYLFFLVKPLSLLESNKWSVVYSSKYATFYTFLHIKHQPNRYTRYTLCNISSNTFRAHLPISVFPFYTGTARQRAPHPPETPPHTKITKLWKCQLLRVSLTICKSSREITEN